MYVVLLIKRLKVFMRSVIPALPTSSRPGVLARFPVDINVLFDYFARP